MKVPFLLLQQCRQARFPTTALLFQLLLFLFPALVQAATIVSVDHRVAVTFSEFQPGAEKGIYSTEVRIKNHSAVPILAPLRLAVGNIEGKLIQALNAEGIGADGLPYIEFALPQGELAPGETTDPITLVFIRGKGKDKDKQEDEGRRVSGSMTQALLAPRASPYALTAGGGPVEVRFTVMLVGKEEATMPVYLRNTASGQIYPMKELGNELGNAQDKVHDKRIHEASVVIDTSALPPETCLPFEAYMDSGGTESVSPPYRLCSSSFPVRVAASDKSKPVALSDDAKAVADEILVNVVPDTSEAQILRLASDINAKVVGSIPPLNFYQLKLPSSVSSNRMTELLAQLGARAEVKAASVNAIGGYASVPSDPEFSNQHGLQRIRANDVWDANATGSGVTVIVLDSGIDRTHPDFGTVGSCQLAENDCGAASTDALGHGTQVAGIVSAQTNNALGIAGIAYGGKIHSIQVSADATITDAEMTQGFTDAAAYGVASVINASFGILNGFANWTPVCAAIDAAVLNGATPVAVVINAAGNNGSNGSFYPSRCNDLNAALTRKDLFITVANSASIVHADCGSVAVDQRCSTSNYGAWVDIAAPGSVIRSTALGGGYVSQTGTSFSAPMVSGAAAILISCGVPLDQIETRLRATSVVTGSDPLVTVSFPDASSAPRLNIHRSLAMGNTAPTAVTLMPNSINENSNTGTGIEVGTLTPTDANTCDKFTYSIVGGTDAAAFNIGGASNDRLRFNAGVVLDREGQFTYQVTVRVTDFFGATFDQPLTVSLNGVNDNAPVFTTSATANVAENNTAVLTVNATDADLPAQTITYSINGGADAAKFTINASTGALSFISAPDFEAPTDVGTNNIYNVTVRANDGAGSTTDQAIAVTVNDQNDNAPVITTAAAQSVNENAAFSVALTSTDVDTVGTASFTITGGADQGLFSIVAGNLTMTARDFEAPTDADVNSTYVVQVTANDGVNNTIKTITVTVNDVNDNAPVITTLAAQSVNENAAFSVALTSTDADMVGTNPATFTITGGTDQALFSIVAGNLTMAAKNFEVPTDADTNNTYVAQVTANDGVNNTIKTITVTVNDQNDNAPVITTAAAQSVNENAAFSVALTSTDADTVGTASFTITGGADQALFSIVASNLTMAAKNFEVPTDADTNNTYVVQVTANDGVNNTIKTITVTVNDQDDPPTGFPTIMGTLTLGQTLTADTSGIADEDSPMGPFSYQWLRGVTDIPAATGSTYTLAAADVGTIANVRVCYTAGPWPQTCLTTVNATNTGDPHITTVDGVHYDFQAAGEFVVLRGNNGMEIQARQTPVSSAAPLANSYTGLTVGVSINTAVAARVGNHRVTLQPDINGSPAAAGLKLRIDGVQTTLPASGISFASGGRIVPITNGAMQVDFPDGTTMVVTPGWWSSHSVWYLNINVYHTTAREGIMGALAKGSWLPALADGSSLGAKPVATHDRYVALYEKFADSWRVNKKTSLFDYARGTSTKTFTFAQWPLEKPPYVIAQGGKAAKPLQRKAAQQLCRTVEGKNNKADCIFDVMVTGHAGFAKTYLLEQKIRAGLTSVVVRGDKGDSRPNASVTFTATVLRHASGGGIVARNKDSRAKAVAITTMPTGSIQFTLDGKNVGQPVKLDSKGQAMIKLPRVKITRHQVGARYIPTKGSVFLPSNSSNLSENIERMRKGTNKKG
ncbi:MAG: S8 family serine peptidase [Gallionellaceae bacterium]|nr:S8 family serine peptidase [Gallionellaceae bacterium]